MKVNKKVVISTATVLGVAALVAGGTIAYFTDKETMENQFTVGDVNITLYESQLHRQNSGREGLFSALSSDHDYCDWTNSQTNVAGKGDMINYDKAKYCTPGVQVDKTYTTGLSAKEAGHTANTWGYSDQTIKNDSENNYAAYFSRTASGVVPGQYVRKFAYVVNEGVSDAYVLISYMVPDDIADNVELKIPHTPYSEGYFTAVKKDDSTNKFVTANVGEYYTVDISDSTAAGFTTYRVYSAVTTDVLKHDEMTFWSPINTVRLLSEVVNDDQTSQNYVESNSLFDVKVEAKAIQAKTFSDAIEAINALQ